MHDRTTRIEARPSINARLLMVAIDHFGRYGIDGASTRAIARDAETTMSAITYHFGGKDGLYLAAAEHIAASIADKLALAEEACRGESAAFPAPLEPAEARIVLHRLVARMIEVIVRDGSPSFARFIIREQAEPTAAFELIYDGALKRLIERIKGLVEAVSAVRLSELEARVHAYTLLGQVLVFRIARATVLAGTGWGEMGNEEVASIERAIACNLDALLDRLASPSMN